MSRGELKFRWNYFLRTLKLWASHGGPFCRDPLSWDLWADEVRVEYHVGTFGQFVKWIITHETFDNL